MAHAIEENVYELMIDWEMTPVDAVTLYLEWGNNNWHGDFVPVRSKSDFTNYFVVDNWGDKLRVMLIRRNSEEANELWSAEVPNDLAERFRDEVGNLRGVYPPNDEIKEWLRKRFVH